MRRVPLILLLGLAAAAILFYVEGLPWVRDIPAWFYGPWDKGLPTWVLATVGIGLGAAFGLGTHALLRRHRGLGAMLALVLASTWLQLATSAVGGMDEVLKRHASGHGKYWGVTADRRGRWLETLLEYEELARDRELGSYAPSKPPGVLVPYMAVDALARTGPVRAALAPLATVARQNERVAPYAETAALSIVLLPTITALLVPLLVALGRLLFADEAAAWGAAVIWASAPATLLIQYHLDGSLYPLLAVASCTLASLAARRDRLAWSVLAGALLVLGVYVSFSLLVAIPLALGCLLVVTIARARAGEERRPLARLAAHVLAAVVGGAVVAGLLWLFLRFDALARYDYAMYYHARWKRSVPADTWRWAALLEYGLYVGVPLVAVFLWRFAAGAFRLVRWRAGGEDLLAVGLLLLLVSLSVSSGTNEVSRMWMLSTPFLALSAATGLRGLARNERWGAAAGWLAAVQITVAIFMKNFQEW